MFCKILKKKPEALFSKHQPQPLNARCTCTSEKYKVNGWNCTLLLTIVLLHEQHAQILKI